MSLVICVFISSMPVQAETVKLSKKQYTMKVGKTYTLKVKGTTAKVKWSSSDKSIATVSKKGKVKAKKPGVVTITAKVKKKKYTCEITIKTKRSGKKGSRTNPISAYKKNTFNYYEEGKKKGKFSMKLLSFISGDEAAEMAKGNTANLAPESDQEYIYFKFQIQYLSGDQTINAKDMFNYYYNIYDYTGKKQQNNLDWGFFFEPIDDLGETILSPGNKVICGKAILIKKGNQPIIYRIQTGKNSYTWFTTEQ